jgi:hypothetical protein
LLIFCRTAILFSRLLFQVSGAQPSTSKGGQKVNNRTGVCWRVYYCFKIWGPGVVTYSCNARHGRHR